MAAARRGGGQMIIRAAWCLLACLVAGGVWADISVTRPAYFAERNLPLEDALRQNRCEEAARYTDKTLAVTQHVDWPLAMLYTGVCYEDRGDGHQALAQYQRVAGAVLGGQYANANYDYAVNQVLLRMALLYQGRLGVAAEPDKVVALCQRVINSEQGSSNDQAHLLMAQTLLQQTGREGPLVIQTLAGGGLQSNLLLAEIAQLRNDPALHHQALERAWGWATDKPALQQALAAQIGQDYADGNGVAQNQAQALNWFLQSGDLAAEKFHRLAQQLPYRLILENGSEWGAKQ